MAELYSNISFWNRNNIIFLINFTGFIIRGILPEGCSLSLAPLPGAACNVGYIELDPNILRSRKKTVTVTLDSFKNYNNMF